MESFTSDRKAKGSGQGGACADIAGLLVHFRCVAAIAPKRTMNSIG
jgi:hypothetical protein